MTFVSIESVKTRVCTVFGSSSPVEGSPEFIQSERLGFLLANENLSIVSGGYCGTMEGVSKGAASARNSNVTIEGVLVPSQFPDRGREGNPYLTKRYYADTLIERVGRLIHSSEVFIVLPGSIGSMAELVAVWNDDYCNRFKGGDNKRALVVCWREPWQQFIDAVIQTLQLDPQKAPKCVYVDSPEEAAKAVVSYFESC